MADLPSISGFAPRPAQPARPDAAAEARAAFFRQILTQTAPANTAPTAAQTTAAAAPVQAPPPAMAAPAASASAPGPLDANGRYPRPGSIINIRV